VAKGLSPAIRFFFRVHGTKLSLFIDVMTVANLVKAVRRFEGSAYLCSCAPTAGRVLMIWER